MTPRETAAYVERLVPGWGASLVMVALIAMIAIAYGAAFGAGLGWALFVAIAGIAALLAYRTAPRIEVTAQGLQAAGALLPWAHLGSVIPLDAAGMREARGLKADARRYLVLRPWAASGGVLVEVRDPQDPHPAWLLSSRQPIDLAAAITAANPAG